MIALPFAAGAGGGEAARYSTRYSSRKSEDSEQKMVEAAGVEGEELLTLHQPAPEISEAYAAGDAAGCHGVADSRNDSLHGLARADSVAAALDRARAAWIARRDSRRLRRDLLRLLAEIED